jgi:hypothetical protein
MNIGNMTYPGAGSGFDTAKTKTPIAITPNPDEPEPKRFVPG